VKGPANSGRHSPRSSSPTAHDRWPAPTGPLDPDPTSPFAREWAPSSLNTPAFLAWALRELNLTGERYRGLLPLIHCPRYEYEDLDHPGGSGGPGVDPAPPPSEILRVAGRAALAVDPRHLEVFGAILHCPKSWASRGRDDLRDFMFPWAICARTWLGGCASGRGASEDCKQSPSLNVRSRELLGVAGLALYVVVRTGRPNMLDTMELDSLVGLIATTAAASEALREAALTARAHSDPSDPGLVLALSRIATVSAATPGPTQTARPAPLVEIGVKLRDLYAAIEEALTRDKESPGYGRLKNLLRRGKSDATTWSDPTIASGLSELEVFGLLTRRGRGTRRRIVALHPIESACAPPREAQPSSQRGGTKAERKPSDSDATTARSVNSARAHTSHHDPRGRRKTGRPAR